MEPKDKILFETLSTLLSIRNCTVKILRGIQLRSLYAPESIDLEWIIVEADKCIEKAESVHFYLKHPDNTVL